MLFRNFVLKNDHSNFFMESLICKLLSILGFFPKVVHRALHVSLRSRKMDAISHRPAIMLQDYACWPSYFSRVLCFHVITHSCSGQIALSREHPPL